MSTTSRPAETPELSCFDSTDQIIAEFNSQHGPDYVYALVSGGEDSDTACEVIHNHPELEIDGVVHVNTGTGIEETRRYVMRRCADWGLPYIELTSYDDACQKQHNHGFRQCEFKIERPPDVYRELDSYFYGTRRDKDNYENLVHKMGFPGPSMHWIMYLALKHKPIKRFVELHHDNDETIAFVSGVRKKESDRRARNISDDGISENWGGCPVISPLTYWSKSQIKEYRLALDLPSNPVADLIGMSGECLCGAYASREELEKLARWGFDSTIRWINNLEHELYQSLVARGYVAPEYALWGHGNSKEENQPEDDETVQMMLCSDCEESCDPAIMEESKGISYGENLIEEKAHCDVWSRWFYCPDCNVIIQDPIEHRRTVHATSPEPPYLQCISWDIRELNQAAFSEASEHRPNNPREMENPVRTDPKLGKETRSETIFYSVDRCSECSYEPYHDGVEHCTECGTFKLKPGDHIDSMITNANEGKPLEDLVTIEPGILTDIIPADAIDETAVFDSVEELHTAVTADEIAMLLIEETGSPAKYLDLDPSFEKLIHDAGLDPLLEEFSLKAADVLDPTYRTDILTAIENEISDSKSKAAVDESLDPTVDPNQSNIASFNS